MLRLGWPSAILLVAFVILVARKPGLLASRAFFPVLLVVAIVLLAQYAATRRTPPR